MAKDYFYEEIIVCLFDHDYHLGFAALANSLVAADFKGLINVAYRNTIPEWVSQLKPKEKDAFYLTDNIVIQFRKVATDMHLGYYKPYFIKQTFENYPAAKKVFYFDVDIIVKAPWVNYSDWLDNGVCLCLDSNFHFLHCTHPWRRAWKKLANPDEEHINNAPHYFNSGFLGIDINGLKLLDRWIDFTENYRKAGGEITYFTYDPFVSIRGDQDLLNAAVTFSADININILGKEGMGFARPATFMEHATGKEKPWRKSFLKHLFKSGFSPNPAEQSFFSFCQHPIRIFPAHIYHFKRLELLVASLFGRLLS